jgi:hypothetical protein
MKMPIIVAALAAAAALALAPDVAAQGAPDEAIQTIILKYNEALDLCSRFIVSNHSADDPACAELYQIKSDLIAKGYCSFMVGKSPMYGWRKGKPEYAGGLCE